MAAFENVGPISPARMPATDEVAARLSQLIAEDQMQVGDPLPSEQALGEMFQVSTRVIREGLRTLAAQGIIRTSQGRRAVVAAASPIAIEAYFKFMGQMDRQSVLELYELREVIEVRATVLAAERATAEEMARARQALEAMAAAEHDVGNYISGDIKFHAAIVDGAHNRFFSGVMTALEGALHAERELGVQNRIRAGKRPRAIREHHAILSAVEAGDLAEAERAILTHMASGRADVRRYLTDQVRARERAAGSSSPAGGGDGPERQSPDRKGGRD
jgi:DNA-binding FadR family transcriptional regulator